MIALQSVTIYASKSVPHSKNVAKRTRVHRNLNVTVAAKVKPDWKTTVLKNPFPLSTEVR